MARWTVGDVGIFSLVEARVDLPCDFLLPGATAAELAAIPWLGAPFVTPDGMVVLQIQAFVVETPETRIVVDTCQGNHKARPSGAGHMLETDFLERLAAAGYPRESIDVVLCTHLHFDHVGWNTMLVDDRWVPTFPNARYLFARTEFEHSQAQRDDRADPTFADSVQPIVDAGLHRLVDADHRIDPWVALVSTPGHTAGHVSVEIASGGDSAFITGDAFHTPVQVARPEWSVFLDHDRAMSARTRHRLLDRLADSPVRMLGTHFPDPTSGRIVRDGAAYRFDPLAPDQA